MLVRLKARGFRNLESLDFELGPGVHLILGPNGAGKTSFLEAVYLLATTKSFRTARVADCCRHGESGFALGGEIETAGVRARLNVSWYEKKRDRRVNGDTTTLAEHLAVLPVVAWTASDVDLLIGSPAERRRFLDRGIVGSRPVALDALGRYRRTVQEKRRLLSDRASKAELDAWNHLLAETATEVIRRRATYVEELSKELAAVLATCRLDIPDVELRYRPSPRKGLEGAERIRGELAAAEKRERRLEQAVLGPHRDDLHILWGGKPVKSVASAGERKAVGLALVTAHGKVLEKHGRPPTYLLDDADTELDRHRLESLWRALGEADQLLATSARPLVWDQLTASKRWRFDGGRVREDS